jgi:hypothetical protein
MAERKAGKLGRRLGVSEIGSRFRLKDYLVDPLPVWIAPDDFTGGVSDWGIAGNDTHGDCGVAGDYHKNMADAQTAGEKALPVPDHGSETESEIVAEYLSYDGGQDNGVDLGQWLTYRLTHALAGLPVIGGFAQVAIRGAEYQSAFHVFGGLYTGIAVNQAMMDEFNQGVPWSSTDTNWIGGHCVPHLARDRSLGKCITWGAVQPFTWANWHATREEAYVVFSPEQINSPGGIFHGVAVAQLRSDILALHGTAA